MGTRTPRSSTYTFVELGKADVKSEVCSGGSGARVVMDVLEMHISIRRPPTFQAVALCVIGRGLGSPVPRQIGEIRHVGAKCMVGGVLRVSGDELLVVARGVEIEGIARIHIDEL